MTKEENVLPNICELEVGQDFDTHDIKVPQQIITCRQAMLEVLRLQSIMIWKYQALEQPTKKIKASH